LDNSDDHTFVVKICFGTTNGHRHPLRIEWL
jgi:hypothetical protein